MGFQKNDTEHNFLKYANINVFFERRWCMVRYVRTIGCPTLLTVSANFIEFILNRKLYLCSTIKELLIPGRILFSFIIAVQISRWRRPHFQQKKKKLSKRLLNKLTIFSWGKKHCTSKTVNLMFYIIAIYFSSHRCLRNETLKSPGPNT